ncbi:MAG: prephenate dehydrogenase, partial [Candidatus Acidiferrales bacterium]
MNVPAPFDRVAIIGTGLIGASFGLALKSAYPSVSIVVFDKPEILGRINEQGFGWKVAKDVAAAARGAQLIYLALPIGAAMEVLPIIAGACGTEALVTDTGSTKASICRLAESEFCGSARFLGGHPIAGKENSGIGNADEALFHGTRYVVIGNERESDERVLRFIGLVHAIGAEPVWSDADTHDWAIAIVSQMPQLMAVALARVIT